MSNLGMGVMINRLFGDGAQTSEAMERSLKRPFDTARIVENGLVFIFDDGQLRVFDDGQSCCEHRYMSTDDDLPYYDGASLIELKVESAPEAEDEYGEVHEQEFLHVKTSKGSFTVVNHNEHNGYYGGFALSAHFVEVETEPLNGNN